MPNMKHIINTTRILLLKVFGNGKPYYLCVFFRYILCILILARFVLSLLLSDSVYSLYSCVPLLALIFIFFFRRFRILRLCLLSFTIIMDSSALITFDACFVSNSGLLDSANNTLEQITEEAPSRKAAIYDTVCYIIYCVSSISYASFMILYAYYRAEAGPDVGYNIDNEVFYTSDFYTILLLYTLVELILILVLLAAIDANLYITFGEDAVQE